MAEVLATKITIYLAGTKIALASFTVAQALVVGALAGGGVALAKRQQSQAKAKLGLFREQELNPLFDSRAPMMAVLGETRISGVFSWFNTINSRDRAEDPTPDVHDIVFELCHCYSPKETATIEGFWLADQYYAYPGDFTALAGPQEGEYPFSYQARRPESRSTGTNYGGRANEKRAGWNTYMQAGYGRMTMIENESTNPTAYYDLPVDSNATATGVLRSAWRCRNTQGNQIVFQGQGGFPPVSAKVKERHYDPRKDSSRTVDNSGFAGNGTQRLNDPTTWEPSNNPIVQWLHYKLWLQSKPLRETRVDWPNLVIPAMNVCDGDVPVPGAPGATEKRYESSLNVYLGGVSDRVNIDSILATCGGNEVRASGKWGVLVPPTPAQIVPVTTITKKDFTGSITFTSKRDDRYGSITGAFTAPDKNYNSTAFPARKDAAEVSRRGYDKNLEIELRGVTSHTQAQRVANSLLKRSNAEQETLSGPINWKALRLQPGAAVNVDLPEFFGNAAKLFAVQELVLNARNSPLSIVLLEVNREAYADMAVADYHSYDAEGNLVPRLPVIPPVTALSATSQQSGILLKWKYPENWIDPQRARIYAARTAAWNDAALVAETPADSFLHTLAGGETRWYWLRNYTDGQESVRTPNDDVSSVTATAGGYAIVGDLDAHGCPPLVGVQGSVFYGRNGTGFFQRGPDFFDGPASAVVGLLWRKPSQAFTVNQTAFTFNAAAVASAGDNGYVESITFKGSADRTALTQITAVVAGDAADDANSIALRDGNGNLASQSLEPLTATTAGNKTTYTGDLTGSAAALVSNIADVFDGAVNLKSATRARIDLRDQTLPNSWFVAPHEPGILLRQLNLYADGSFGFSVRTSGASGEQDELTDRIERDIRIVLRNRTTGVALDVPGPNAAVTQSKDTEGTFYRFTPDAGTAAKITAELNATSLNTHYDALVYDSAALTMALGLAETDKRCSGNVANPWVPELSAAAGVDGVGIEDIFAWFSSDTLPASKQPNNSWGYDSGGTSDGLVWSDAAGEGSKTNPWLHKWSRATEGTPAAGDAVDGQWYSNFIAKLYGEKGDAGDKGDTDLEVTLYQAITSGSAFPAKPTGITYNFDTDNFGGLGSWQRTYPNNYDEHTQTVVCSHGHFSGSGTAFSIPNSRWSNVIACSHDFVADYIFKESATEITTAPADSTTQVPATWHGTISAAKAAVSGENQLYKIFQIRDPETGVWARQLPVPVQGEKGDAGITASQDGPVEFTGRGTNWTPSGYQYVTAPWVQDGIEKFAVRIQYRVSQASQTDTEAGNIQVGVRQYRVNRGNWQTWTTNPTGVTKSLLSSGSPHASWVVAWKGVEVALRAYSVKDGADGAGTDGALPYFRGNWASGVDYNAGDVVTYPRTWTIPKPPPQQGTIDVTVQGFFRCRVGHTSSNSNQPNRSGAANTNWELYFGQFTSTPGAPTNPRTSAVTSSGLTFAWNAPSQAVTNYVVQWKVHTAQSWGTEYTTTSTSYAVPSLSPNATYDLRVKARHTLDGVNYDSDYATAHATTTSTTPSGFTVAVETEVHRRGTTPATWNVLATATPTGGTSPYSYVFSGSPISHSGDDAVYRITAAGTYNESVTVTDSTGASVTKAFSFVVS